MAIKKNIIKEALANAKEIETFAFDSAKKELEESISSQVDKTVRDILKDFENNSSQEKEEVVKEGIKLDIAPDASLNISISPEGSTIELDNTGAMASEETPETINTDSEMVTNDQDDIYEVEGAELTPDASVEPTSDAAMTEPEPSLTDLENKISDMASKIDSILNAVNPEAGTGSEGAVDVIDDESANAAPAPAAQAPAAPAPQMPTDNVVSEDDMMFEIDEEFMKALSEELGTIKEDSMDEVSLSEMNDLDEIEIVAEKEKDNEEDEETMEEMKGLGNTVARSAGNRQKLEKNKFQHAAAMNEDVESIKVHYESKMDELIQENESLKQAIEDYRANIQEYSNSFVELQKQINEMHVFNGKLAYANRLLSKGGLTNAEKIKIAEAFDKAKSVEEAKKLYNNFLKEMKENDATPISKDVKTPKPNVAASTSNSQTETIFESEERKRWKKLAGITMISEGK